MMTTNAEVAAALDAELVESSAPQFDVAAHEESERENAKLTLGVTDADLAKLKGGAVKGGVYIPEGYEVEAPAPTPPTAQPEVEAFPFDAALQDPPGMRPLFPRSSAFAFVADAIRNQVKAEAHHDFKVSVTDLLMRRADGAISRGKPGGLAYTRHGFGQLIALMLDTKPANLAGCMRWVRPERRADVFNADVKPRTSRKADDLIVLRTFAARRPGTKTNETVRAFRAAVSVRHSQAALDDVNMLEALGAELGPNAPTDCSRSIDETHGVAIVGTTAKHLHRTLHWTNSETGCASMSFTAGAVIRFVDALVRLDGTKDTVEVTLEDEATKSRMRHTAPGGKKSPAEQAKVARERMQARIRKVLTAGEAVEGMWEAALVTYPGALKDRDGDDGRERFLKMAPEAAFEVLADLLEEANAFAKETDRAELLAVLKDETRLAQLPRGSAAHVAAAFAVLGARAKDNETSTRWQSIAGRWLARGWV